MNFASIKRQPALWIFFALWALTTAYIALLPTRHFTLDAINNLLFTEQNSIYELWHPQHLLAQWPGYWLYQFLNPLSGGSVRAWQAIQVSGAIMGGATVAITFSLLLTLTRSVRIAVLCALGLWVSYGFWHFQSDTDVYSPVYLSVVLLLWAYTRYLFLPTTRRVLALGLCGALAFLSHQLNVELAGLIGLSLLYLAFRHNHTPGITGRHVAIFAILFIGIVGAFYVLGWLNASAYLVQVGATKPSFTEWALRYFVSAGQGKATWGNKLNLATMPAAGYTFLSSWILPPLLSAMTGWQAILIGILVFSLVVVLAHMLIVLRHLDMPYQWVTLICALTLIANFLSGWWWASGNIKFYLMMQLDLIVLVALYARYSCGFWARYISRAALSAVALCLILFHVTITLPYERHGGVFTVTDQIGKQPISVWFSRLDYQTLYDHLSTRTSHYLPPGFCQAPPPLDDPAEVWWVVDVQENPACPPVANAIKLGQFQSDRTRATYVIFRMKPATP